MGSGNGDRRPRTRIGCPGEASHGTHGFYDWRAGVTRRLIEEKGFSFVAVEGNRPGEVDAAMQAWRCFEPYAEDPRSYARATRLVLSKTG